MSILKLLFFKHVSVKSQGSSGGVVYLILILLMKILTVITKLDLQSAGSSPNLTYTKISALDAIRIL